MGSNHGPRNENRRIPARTVSATEARRAIVRATLRVEPATSTAPNPAAGTMRRRESRKLISRPPEDARQQPENHGEDEDSGDPEDDHPRVVLDLSGLAGAEGEARPDCLETDAVHRAIDHLAVEEVRDGGGDHGPPADRVHESVHHVP